VRISDIDVTRGDGGAELAGSIDGFRLFFRFPASLQVSKRGDAFLAAALLPAMRASEPIEVDPRYPVSPRLLAGVTSIQDVFATWDPALKRVVVDARAEPDSAVNDGVGSFFSGGVDGLYTLLKHADEVTDLLFVQGIDMQVDNDELFAEVLRANEHFARARGKRLIPIQSNLRRFCHPRGVPWTVYNGAGLASLGLALSLRKIFIASSHTYRELLPWGSHPLTDPLWSTEGVSFVHDGAEATRTQKVSLLGRDRDALAILRVCWQDKGYNCGRCEKCLRTMTSLRLLGLSSERLPRLETLDAVRKLVLWDESSRGFWDETLKLAETVGDRAVATAVRRLVSRHDLRRALSRLGDTFAGGRVKSWYRAVRAAITG